NINARILLAEEYNRTGRYEEAATLTEVAPRRGRIHLRLGLERATAYYHLGRFEEGLAVLNAIQFADSATPRVRYWKGRFCEKLGRFDDADTAYKSATTLAEDLPFKTAYAEFLALQNRWREASELVDQILRASPSDTTGLRLRASCRRHAPLS